MVQTYFHYDTIHDIFVQVGVGSCNFGSTCALLFFTVFFTGVALPVVLVARFPGTKEVGELGGICANVGCCSVAGGEGGVGNSAFKSASNEEAKTKNTGEII